MALPRSVGRGHQPKVRTKSRKWGMTAPASAQHPMVSMPLTTYADRSISGDGDLDAPKADARARQLALLIRAVAIAGAMVGGLEALSGFAYGEARAVVLGLSAVTYGGWLAILSKRFDDLRQAETISRIAAVTLVLVAMAAILEPAIAFAMAIASLLPIVLVLPFLGSRAIGRILIIGGIVGLGSVIVGELLPRGDRMPAALTAAVASLTLVFVYGFLLIFLWEVSRRMKTTADDLRSVVAMSNEDRKSVV